MLISETFVNWNLNMSKTLSKVLLSFYFVDSCYSSLEMKSTSPSVIVIGAGFSGITAARTLHDASFQVHT